MQGNGERRISKSKCFAVAAAVPLVVALTLCLSARAANDAYSFELTELTSGQKMQLSELTADKPLVVLVWSPLCPHCQRHMPYFVGLYSKLDLDSVNVATIAVECTKDEAQDYVDRRKLAFPVLLAKSGRVSDGFFKQGWPTTYVFGVGGQFAGYVDSTGPPYINDVLALIEKAQH